MEKFRLFLQKIFEEKTSRGARILNGALIFLIIFSVVILPLHFFPDTEWLHDEIFWVDRAILTIFTAEFFLRFWAAKNPLKYFFSIFGAIDLLVILPFFLAKFQLFFHPEIFFLFRFLRILKFAEICANENENLELKNVRIHGEFSAIDGEILEKIVQKHPLIFLLHLIFPIFLASAGATIFVFFAGNFFAQIFLILIFLLATIFFAKAWLDHNYDVIYITNRQIIFQDREIFGTSSNAISYDTITNVVPKSIGFLQMIFHFGSIEIETAGTSGQFLFSDAPQPHKIAEKISQNRQKFLEKNSLEKKIAPEN